MENNTDQAVPTEQLDAGTPAPAPAPAEDTGASSSEQPVDHRTDLAGDTDAAQSSENADVVESPEFPERAFTEGDTDGRVQSSAQDRVFVPGVGFVDVSHPE